MAVVACGSCAIRSSPDAEKWNGSSGSAMNCAIGRCQRKSPYEITPSQVSQRVASTRLGRPPALSPKTAGSRIRQAMVADRATDASVFGIGWRWASVCTMPVRPSGSVTRIRPTKATAAPAQHSSGRAVTRPTRRPPAPARSAATLATASAMPTASQTSWPARLVATRSETTLRCASTWTSTASAAAAASGTSSARSQPSGPRRAARRPMPSAHSGSNR